MTRNLSGKMNGSELHCILHPTVKTSLHFLIAGIPDHTHTHTPAVIPFSALDELNKYHNKAECLLSDIKGL